MSACTVVLMPVIMCMSVRMSGSISVSVSMSVGMSSFHWQCRHRYIGSLPFPSNLRQFFGTLAQPPFHLLSASSSCGRGWAAASPEIARSSTSNLEAISPFWNFPPLTNSGRKMEIPGMRNPSLPSASFRLVDLLLTNPIRGAGGRVKFGETQIEVCGVDCVCGEMCVDTHSNHWQMRKTLNYFYQTKLNKQNFTSF